MSYTPTQPREGQDPVDWAHQEFRRLSGDLRAFETAQMSLVPLPAAPTKPREGMLAHADGVNWMVGSPGIYIYRAGAWMKLFDFGANTVWTDIDFPIIIRTSGPNIPVLATLQGNILIPQWAVNDYAVCEGQELFHQWKEGTDGSWHIHLVTNGLDGTDRYVKFELEWCWVRPNQVLSASTTITTADLLIPANTPSKTMKIFTIGPAVLTGGVIGSQVYARLKRIASSGAAPTNNPWIPMLQMHVECDSLGSRSMTTK